MIHVAVASRMTASVGSIQQLCQLHLRHLLRRSLLVLLLIPPIIAGTNHLPVASPQRGHWRTLPGSSADQTTHVKINLPYAR
ncbi:hypothetical protein ACLBR5_28925 [Escherichia coli]